jgi:phospholipid-binding lipoprotein MlaA
MNRSKPRLGLSGVIVIAACGLAGCVAQTKPSAVGAENFNDPLEPTNRAIFSLNQGIDHDLLAPAARAYRAVLPEGVRDSVHNFFRNLRGPVIFANDALQGDVPRAGETLARFVINSTVGIGGLIDVAAKTGLPYHDQDFGLTFAVWGIGSGPYLVLPILGPSNPRDLAGTVAEGFADPWNNLASDNGYTWVTFVRDAVSGIDERSRYLDSLADLERTSLDYYAAIRSLYRQRRAALIHHEQHNLPANPSLGQGDGGPDSPVLATNPPAPAGVRPE